MVCKGLGRASVLILANKLLYDTRNASRDSPLGLHRKRDSLSASYSPETGNAVCEATLVSHRKRNSLYSSDRKCCLRGVSTNGVSHSKKYSLSAFYSPETGNVVCKTALVRHRKMAAFLCPTLQSQEMLSARRL
jgi:hypothetical protein